MIKTVFLICISFLLPLSWYLDYRRITCTLQENDEEPGTDEHSRRREPVSDKVFKDLVTFLIIAVVDNDYGWKAVVFFLFPVLFVLSLPSDRRGVAFERALTLLRINLRCIQHPDIQVPDLRLPDIELPHIDLSRFSIPQINLPHINLLLKQPPRDDIPALPLPRQLNIMLVYISAMTIWALIMQIIHYAQDNDNLAMMEDFPEPNVTRIYVESFQEVVILFASNATVAVLSPHAV